MDYNNNNQDYPFFDSNSDDLDYPVGSLDQASTSSLCSAINAQKNIQQKKKPNTNTKVSSKFNCCQGLGLNHQPRNPRNTVWNTVFFMNNFIRYKKI